MVCVKENEQSYADGILSAPPITNRHIWMYLVNKRGTLTYEELGRIVDEYKKDNSASVYDLCKAVGVHCNEIKRDIIMHTIRFDYRSSDNIFKEAIRDLNMLCGVGEVDHRISYSKKDNVTEEAFFHSFLGGDHSIVLNNIWNRRLSRKEVRDGVFKVYAAPSLSDHMSIE